MTNNNDHTGRDFALGALIGLIVYGLWRLRVLGILILSIAFVALMLAYDPGAPRHVHNPSLTAARWVVGSALAVLIVLRLRRAWMSFRELD